MVGMFRGGGGRKQAFPSRRSRLPHLAFEIYNSTHKSWYSRSLIEEKILTVVTARWNRCWQGEREREEGE